MSSARKPTVGVLLGDPTGIGPELVAKLLASPGTTDRANVLLIADPALYHEGARIAGLQPAAVDTFAYSDGTDLYPSAKVSPAAGAYALGSLRLAVNLLRKRMIDAIVYAPLNKQALKLAGMNHEDELHYFASLLNYSGTVSEINVCGGLWTSRVTSHVPLRDVADLITVERICAAAELLHRSLITGGVAAPRLAIAALNPHAGEGGLMGSEEITTITPAAERLRVAGINAAGPLPADTLFIAARRGDFDGVVSMYHDQGQIALKLLGFERGITVSGGLPVPITTPAHGTAFDIAGKGVADVRALTEAFHLAVRMAS